jgi:predicted ATP-grasp superfamily ATP-dependent carboligase
MQSDDGLDSRPGDGQSAAVVMGLTPTGLALCRALGRRGLPVVGISSDPRNALARSRFLRFVPGPGQEDEDALCAFYLDLARRLDGPPVLLPTGDRNVSFLSRYRSELEGAYRFFVPPADLLEELTSKRRLVALSERSSLPLPRTLLPESREELERALETLELPCVLKPEFTHLWQSQELGPLGLRGEKAVAVRTREELLDLYEKVSRVEPRILVQRMVLGPDENHIDYHAFVDPQGRTRAEFVGRKLRLTPPHYGMGCFVESAHDEEALEEGRALLRALSYRGMANVNFKRDERDGRLYLFELNPRFSFWTGLDVACGIDFPYYYYRECLGLDYEAPPGYPAGRRWLNLRADRRAMRVYSRDGTWTWGRWLVSVLRPSVGAVFAWDDPAPFLASVGGALASRLGLRRGRS